MDGERAWIEAARAGDKQAFGRLVEAYQRPIFSLAYRMLGNAGDAEDAAQEVFLKAYRALGSYDRQRPFSTWLLSIAAHYCIDRLRRRRMQAVSLDDLPTWRWGPGDAVDPQRAAEASDQAGRIQRLLGDLPEDYRLVIVLRYWHDLGYEEIAGVTGQTVSAVKSRLHRARGQLAIRLEGGSHDDSGRTAGAGRRTISAGGIKACSATLPAN